MSTTAMGSLRRRLREPLVVLGVVLLGASALAGVVVFVKLVPPWIASTDGLTGKDRAEEIGRARTAVLAILAGAVAIVGAVLTGLSYRLNRAGQITERFTRAIDQLGSSELDVHLGGIYALERIARDSSHDHPQVVEVLTAYVRGHARWRPDRPQASTAVPASQGTPDERIEANPGARADRQGLG